MKKILAVIGTVLSLASASVVAQGVQQNEFYVGGGFSNNDVSSWDDATGYQVFVGYSLDRWLNFGLEDLSFAAELGYMDSGDFERRVCFLNFGCFKDETSASGVWTSAVASYSLSPEFKLIGRIGVDFGDDDGALLGIGAGYQFNNAFELRGEYVVRDEIDSLQLNLVYRFQ